MLLPFQPALGIFILALGPVTVPAKMIAVEHILTLRAEIGLSSQSLGATLFNRTHRFEMVGRHPRGVLLAIQISVTTKYVRQFYPQRFPRI
jgi:hypothetical protein